MSRTVESDVSRAISAFDGVADAFDRRYSAWLTVQAQRRAVRRYLLRTFPPGACLLELGGGTGDDASFLAGRGRSVLLTDGSPRMVAFAAARARTLNLEARMSCQVVPLERFEAFAADRLLAGSPPFDGAFSNFAALNCVSDLRPIGRALSGLVRAGGRVTLVVFGPCPPAEIFIQLLRLDPPAAFRRFRRGDVPAQLGGRTFVVRYPGPGAFGRAFAPRFRLRHIRGIGVFVPPSAAEPGMSAFPRLVRVLEALDHLASAPLALFGDHVLLDFERTHESAAPAMLEH